MRSATLNILSGLATLAILAVLALPAKRVFEGAQVPPRAAVSSAAPRAAAPSVAQSADAPSTAHPPAAAHPSRVFGAYVDPWHVDDWARAVGAMPQAVAKFEAFSRGRTLDEWNAEAHRQGLRRQLVSWEPWAPVPAALGLAAQSAAQPGYRNIDVARGAQDRYIMRFARSLARFRGTVWLRYAHEMNGYWYPWSRGPRAYRWAWRRIVRLFGVAGADNVRFVWSVNANLYESEAAWRRNARRYWPGDRYVDAVGSTMIDFGGEKDYDVARFAPRLRALHAAFGKPVVLTETNTELDGRVKWLRDLRRMLRGMPWVEAVMWSQLPSRGKVHRAAQNGIVDWDVQRDPPAAAVLRGIVEDGAR